MLSLSNHHIREGDSVAALIVIANLPLVLRFHLPDLVAPVRGGARTRLLLKLAFYEQVVRYCISGLLQEDSLLMRHIL